MPHFGEIQSLVGTLRKDGFVSRRDNALRTADNEEWLWEDGAVVAFEDGSEMVLE